MANYAGLHNGTDIYCGIALQPWLTTDGTITGITCNSIYANGTVGSLVINGSTIAMAAGNTLDVTISTATGTLTNACFLCTCFDCSDPLEGYTYSTENIAYNFSGSTWIGGDGGSGDGSHRAGIRPVTRGSSDPTTILTRLGMQGLQN